MAVKTNLAVWAATVANLGVEFGFGRHYSVDVPVIYSPYTVRRVYRMNLFAVQPEFRYWLDRPFRGHFSGSTCTAADSTSRSMPGPAIRIVGPSGGAGDQLRLCRQSR
ncbi:MAG: DUF3575 domain-containing protein [Alistipes indistinctus]